MGSCCCKCSKETSNQQRLKEFEELEIETFGPLGPEVDDDADVAQEIESKWSPGRQYAAHMSREKMAGKFTRISQSEHKGGRKFNSFRKSRGRRVKDDIQGKLAKSIVQHENPDSPALSDSNKELEEKLFARFLTSENGDGHRARKRLEDTMEWRRVERADFVLNEV